MMFEFISGGLYKRKLQRKRIPPFKKVFLHSVSCEAGITYNIYQNYLKPKSYIVFSLENNVLKT